MACTFEPCDRPVLARGMCRRHYQRQYQRPDQPPCSLVSPEGFPYSLDGSHYEPRCNVCHALFDQARNRPHFFVGCV